MKGIGIDILSVDRFKKAVNRQKKLLEKIFTNQELLYCKKHKNPYINLTARFCAKEAVAKALGIGFGKNISFLDIEIKHDKNKKPKIILSKKILKKFKNPKILISFSHDKEYACATAIWIS